MRGLRLLLLVVLVFPCCAAIGAPAPSVVQYGLPSALPCGVPNIDTIVLRYYPVPGSSAAAPTPAVVIVPPLGSTEADPLMNFFARHLVRQGIAAAVIDLPYHGRRAYRHIDPAGFFVSANFSLTAHAFRQSASDISTAAAWLASRPEVNPMKLGVVGVSLGAIVAHLAMGLDDRLTAGVAILGGGDLAYMGRRSLQVTLPEMIYHERVDTTDAAALLRAADPLTYANQNRPRRVLMIEAARDVIIPPRSARELWDALGRPPIRWVDTNHFAIALTPFSCVQASGDYLLDVWGADPHTDPPLPRVWAPTLKVGLFLMKDSGIQPAVTWQAVPIGTRSDHMALFHLDLGVTSSRPYGALGLTLNPYTDVGFAVRTGDRTPQPYAGLFITY